MSAPHKRGGHRSAANDNTPRHRVLDVEADIPADLPLQTVEVEVLAQLLDSLPANDNEETA